MWDSHVAPDVMRVLVRHNAFMSTAKGTPTVAGVPNR